MLWLIVDTIPLYRDRLLAMREKNLLLFFRRKTMVVADQIVEGECLVVVDTVDAVVDCGYDSMLWRYIACTLEKNPY